MLHVKEYEQSQRYKILFQTALFRFYLKHKVYVDKNLVS